MTRRESTPPKPTIKETKAFERDLKLLLPPLAERLEIEQGLFGQKAAIKRLIAHLRRECHISISSENLQETDNNYTFSFVFEPSQLDSVNEVLQVFLPSIVGLQEKNSVFSVNAQTGQYQLILVFVKK